MKNSIKSALLKSACVAAAVTLGAIGYSQANKVEVNKQAAIQLRDLSRISNANAEGSATCGAAGSNCLITYNGQPYEIVGYKQP